MTIILNGNDMVVKTDARFSKSVDELYAQLAASEEDGEE